MVGEVEVTKHGESSVLGSGASPEYTAWRNMRARCLNSGHPLYANYGGRGITICDRWRDFAAFREDMGTRPSRAHSIDRRDNSIGYGPENCRWATTTEQTRNRRVWRTSKTGFRGVYTERKGYWASITVSGQQIRLGAFTSLSEAVGARLAAEEKYWCGVSS